MNLQQLRIVRETVRSQFNLTEAANRLFTSQSGLSKHIKDLEEELGVELFIRKGKRLLGLTEPGQDLVKLVERMLLDAENLKSVAAQYTQKDEGELIIASTHTQSRYVLPAVVVAFKKAFPKVHLKLHQGSPDEIAKMLLEGRADVGIATEMLAEVSELVTFPYYTWQHAVVTPKDHPLVHLQNKQPLTLHDVAQYPIITYHEGYTGRSVIDKAFLTEGIEPDIVITAMDSDVIKTYIELNFGVGIIASMAFDATRDTHLELIHNSQLFGYNQTVLAIREGRMLRQFAYKFINLCNPNAFSEV